MAYGTLGRNIYSRVIGGMKSQRNTTIAMILALVVIALFVSLGFFGVRSFGGNEAAVGSGPQAILDELAQSGTVADLRTYDIVTGEGAEAVSGAVLVVHYTGVLPDGTVFDSSVNRGEPFAFQLGSGQVIQGWERGFVGMKEGGRRLLAIPPSLGYGVRGQGTIPPNATLIFEVELLQVIPAGEVQGASSEDGASLDTTDSASE